MESLPTDKRRLVERGPTVPGRDRASGRWSRGGWLAVWWAGCLVWGGFGVGAEVLRPPVHPRRNVDEIPVQPARWVRFTILETNRSEPCLDEIEVFNADDPPANVALASAGARVTVSGSLIGYGIHRQEHLNDGMYGNGRSWISDRLGEGWVEIELPRVERIQRVVWGRDREGRFIDRLPVRYRIEVATEPGVWRVVASSEDRLPPASGESVIGPNPSHRFAINRFAPVDTSLSHGAPSVTPAEYAVRVWRIEEGLPANTVTAVLPARDGYLWVGTFNGLARFDGARFVVYGEAEGLVNPRVTCLWEDAEGALWVGTEGGGVVRREKGRFTTFTTADGLSDNFILALAGDARGRLWVGTRSGLDRLERGRAVVHPAEGQWSGHAISRLAATGTDDLWVFGDRLRLWRNERFQPPPFEDEPAAFTSLVAVHQGPSGALWVGGANGYVSRLAEEGVSVFGREEGLPSDLVSELLETRNGDLWVGTASGGLSRLREGRFLHLTTRDGLPHHSVRALAEDREGSLWAGSQGGGLVRLRPRPFTVHTTDHGLSHNVVMSMAEDAAGRVWIGSNCGGLNVWQDGTVTPYESHYLLDNECIWPMWASGEGGLWIGTWGGGLFRLQQDQLFNYQPEHGLAHATVLSLTEDQAGSLWIGTFSGGLNRYQDGAFTRYTTADGLTSDTITAVVEDAPGELWIGTDGGGLNRMADGRFTALRRSDGLTSDFVRTLRRDGEGRLWVGTSGGLSLVMDGVCHGFTTAQGLLDPVISQILEDDSGHLWLGSHQGISRVAKADLLAVAEGRATVVTPLSYGREEGMENPECTGGFHPAGLKTRDGYLWFSTVKGLVRVNPREAVSNTVIPWVRIESVGMDQQVHEVPELEDRAALAVPTGSKGRSRLQVMPGVLRLEFRYTALSLAAPGKVRFRYQLEGMDQDWTEAGTRRWAEYTHVPPGHYRFRVVAANNDGVWNLEGASVDLEVLPPFWRTWWFLGLAGLGGVGTTIAGVRWVALRKLRARLQRVEHQHALERERTRIARDLHDDLGSGLTQIALLSALGERHQGPSKEGADSFREIARRARAMVRSMDAIVWAVDPTHDTLDHLAGYLPEFAREFLRTAGLRCRLDVPAVLPSVPLTSEVRHSLLLAAKEALHNVVKHAQASEVWVRLAVESDELTLVVEDDGCGLPASPPSGMEAGQGLNNLRRRMAELGGTAVIGPGRGGRGTSVRLVLPLACVRAGRSASVEST